MIISYGPAALAALGIAANLALSPMTPTKAQGQFGAALFSRLDTNGDGQIDEKELEAARRAYFKQLDVNGDGIISQTELDRALERIYRRALMAGMALSSRFEQMDINGDLQVSESEFIAGPPSVLRAIADTNGDGIVTREEFERVAAALRARRSAGK